MVSGQLYQKMITGQNRTGFWLEGKCGTRAWWAWFPVRKAMGLYGAGNDYCQPDQRQEPYLEGWVDLGLVKVPWIPHHHGLRTHSNLQMSITLFNAMNRWGTEELIKSWSKTFGNAVNCFVEGGRRRTSWAHLSFSRPWRKQSSVWMESSGQALTHITASRALGLGGLSSGL